MKPIKRDKMIDGAYVQTPCATQAIETWWPQKDSARGHDFEQRMRAMQADLIRCHAAEMSDEDRERAAETLAWLEQ
jgi:hypothetical protein